MPRIAIPPFIPSGLFRAAGGARCTGPGARLRESPSRSALKAISYRLAGTSVTAAAALALTGDLSVAFALGGLDLVLKAFVFYAHERLWSRIPFGLDVEGE